MSPRGAFLSGSFILAATLATAPQARAGEITRDGGVLGCPLSYDLTGNPGILYAFAPSFSAGPTPLFIFDPGNPGVLDIGLDLIPLLKVSAFDGFGFSSVDYGTLPAQASLSGLVMRAQMVEIPFFPNFLGDISPLNAFTLGIAGDTHFTIGNNVDGLYGHTAETLDDGRVLLIGGYDDDAPGINNFRDTYVMFDNQTETYSVLLGLMAEPRGAHASVKLEDGRVLSVGGADPAGTSIMTAEIWDPVTETAAFVATMNEQRTLPTLTLMNDGRVFCSGGVKNWTFTDVIGSLNAATASTEVYDPVADTWTPGPNLPKGRVGHQASLLGDGTVLITGGLEITTLFGMSTLTLTNTCQRYDPVTDTFLPTASFTGQRALHGQVTLNNGNALIAGGFDGNVVTLMLSGLTSTAVYNFQNNTWTNTASLNSGRGNVQLLNTGDEIVALGGFTSVDFQTFAGPGSTAIDTAPQSILFWTSQPPMKTGRQLAISNVFGGGKKILTTGAGFETFGPLDDTGEIFFP